MWGNLSFQFTDFWFSSDSRLGYLYKTDLVLSDTILFQNRRCYRALLLVMFFVGSLWGSHTIWIDCNADQNQTRMLFVRTKRTKKNQKIELFKNLHHLHDVNNETLSFKVWTDSWRSKISVNSFFKNALLEVLSIDSKQQN